MSKSVRRIAVFLPVLLAALSALASDPVELGFAAPWVRQQAVDHLTLRSIEAKTWAWDIALSEGYVPKKHVAGRLYELMAIRDGRLYVCATRNQNAAISTAVDLVRNTAPYNLNGAGVVFGLWDGGAALTSHQELTGRVTVLDDATTHDHATHVAGTIGASGVQAAALGMAPSITFHAYEWTNDVGEMAARGMSYAGEPGTIQLSNHSYGYLSGWAFDGEYTWYGTWGDRESDLFGQYEAEASTWDAVCHAAPYYLPIKAAGDDRSDDAPDAGTDFWYYQNGFHTKTYNPATDPYDDGWDNGGFDTMTSVACAKNVLTVGAVSDAVSAGTRSLAAAAMTSYSGWGPTDDGRIKPDVVANGQALYSCVSTTSTSYDTYSGVSMATANASGSAALLVEYYGELLPGRYMRASTIKALILHTADDLGTAGPDYAFGWGLLNTKAAADHIAAHASDTTAGRIIEGTITTASATRSYQFTWDGTSPIRATLCWTDPSAWPVSGLDNPARRLVNDLDLRIIGPGGSPVYYPFVLDPSHPSVAATRGDNDVDNVEQVLVASPTGALTFTIRVSREGLVTGGTQHFSLLVSGATSGQPPHGTLWRKTTGEVDIWLANSQSTLGGGTITTVDPGLGWEIRGVGDLDGDGRSDIIWRNTDTGQVAAWVMHGLTLHRAGIIATVDPASGWAIKGIGDFDGDGLSDILWRDATTGQVAVWLLRNLRFYRAGVVATVDPSSGWTIQGVGDFSGDGKADVLWRDSASGVVAIWRMNGVAFAGAAFVSTVDPVLNWAIEGLGDFNADGTSDILWRNGTSGEVAIWLMNRTRFARGTVIGLVDPLTAWAIRGTGDFDGDGRDDLVWGNPTTGELAVWRTNGVSVLGTAVVRTVNPADGWTLKGLGDFK